MFELFISSENKEASVEETEIVVRVVVVDKVGGLVVFVSDTLSNNDEEDKV